MTDSDVNATGPQSQAGAPPREPALPYPGVRERYRDVCRRVAAAAEASGRSAGDVLIVAVTKFAQPEQIRQLIELGHADFGENRVQNLVKRIAPIEEFVARHRTLTSSKRVDLPDRIRWHMIGHLQRNKVKKVLDLVTLIHSVDTLRLAEEIQEAAMRLDRAVDVLIQVNASMEKSKYGLAMPAARHLAQMIGTMANIRLRGLMTLGPLTDDESQVRMCFERCYDCFIEIQNSGKGGRAFNILSMGMSNDFELAIEYGANVVRIGSAIFGEHTEATSDEAGDSDDSGAESARLLL